MKYVLTALFSVALSVLFFFTYPKEQESQKPESNYVHSFSFEVNIQGDTLEVYNQFVGDVTPWWDHYFSLDKPYKMFIEAQPGGGFYEYFDKEGNGVKHAEVIVAIPGKLLRMEGPLGLTGRATLGVYSLEFNPSEDGNTTITFSCNMSGQIDKQIGDIVEQVWRHFLITQFKTYVEAK